MRTVCEQNKNAFLDGVDPETRARESVVSKTFRGHFRARRRAVGRGELKREGAVFVHAFREIRAKQFAGFRFQNPRVVRQKLLRDFEYFFGR